MKMRKCGWVLLVLCLLLAGCQRSNVANLGQTLEDWRPESNPDYSTGASDIVAYDTPAVGVSTGFDIVMWPDTRQLGLERVFAVDGWFAQLEYRTDDERILVVRVADATKKPLSTTYVESHYASLDTYDWDGLEVKVQTGSAGCTMASWARDGFQYLVHSNQRYATPSLEELEQFVRGLDSRAV